MVTRVDHERVSRRQTRPHPKRGVARVPKFFETAYLRPNGLTKSDESLYDNACEGVAVEECIFAASSVFLGVNHAPVSSGGATYPRKNEGTYYMRSHSMRNSNILYGAKSRL